MNKNFNLLMIGAMYENGGNTVHRFLDGHPQMFVYPFESQLGTSLVQDHLTSLFPVKYRWPVFPLEGSAVGDYKMIIDEEAKVRSRTPQVSKFRHIDFEFSDDERFRCYEGYIKKHGRSRANNVAAFFRGTFDAWKNYRRTGKETWHVGYSPALVVDAEKFLQDFPQGHFLHVVRNPWSAYSDTKKRPVPLPLERYTFLWNINQYFALLYQKMYPQRVHIIRLEDVLADSHKTLGDLCGKIGIKKADSLRSVSWNGADLDEVYPWGTIRRASVAANRATADELSKAEKEAVRLRTEPFLQTLNYSKFLK
jgi:hypothetical protein